MGPKIQTTTVNLFQQRKPNNKHFLPERQIRIDCRLHSKCTLPTNKFISSSMKSIKEWSAKSNKSERYVDHLVMESLEEVAAREEAERQQSLRDLEQLYEWLQQFEDPPPAPRPPPPYQFRNGTYFFTFFLTVSWMNITVKVILSSLTCYRNFLFVLFAFDFFLMSGTVLGNYIYKWL